jgi:hypothetical protein
MRFGYNVTKPVTHPFGFDDINVRVLGSCSGSRCSSITLNFNENGTYKSFALIGLSDEYVSKGVYGLDDVGRIYFSEDCKESANMNVMFMFQRAFFNIISLKSGAGVLNDYGRNFLNAEYTIEEICGG